MNQSFVRGQAYAYLYQARTALIDAERILLQLDQKQDIAALVLVGKTLREIQIRLRDVSE